MTAYNFIYHSTPARVIFARGALGQLAEEVEAAGMHGVLVLCTPQQRPLAELAAGYLGAKALGIFDKARLHVPVEIAQAAADHAASVMATGVVAIGGGSTIGLAKAIALETGLPHVAVPTTYAGSEMTPIYGLTSGGEKRTGRDMRVLPKSVIYDADLTVNLPLSISVTSGLNAVAHAAEGLYARDGNPLLDVIAEEGIRSMVAGLANLKSAASNVDGRDLCLSGAWLCGTVLGQAGMALHHKLCHVMGGVLDLPHAEMHTVMLPHTLSYNANAAPAAMYRIARAIGAPNACIGLYELADRLGAPMSLRSLGVAEADLSRVADTACANPYWNPRPVERDAVLRMLRIAWAGERPEV